MKFVWGFLLVALIGCSTYRGQNRIQENTVKFPGGVYKDLSWDDSLVFKRTQFFIGATLYYDVLAAPLNSGSPFLNWVGDAKDEVAKCDRLYVLMLYRNIRRAVPQRNVISQVEAQGWSVVSLHDFERNLREHYVTDEMHFLGHKVIGLCHTGGGESNEMELFLPGFKRVDLL